MPSICAVQNDGDELGVRQGCFMPISDGSTQMLDFKSGHLSLRCGNSPPSAFTVGFTQPIYDWRIRVRVANPCEIVTAFLPPTAKPRPTTTRGTRRPQICESKRPTTIEGWRARACAAGRAFKRLLQKSIGHDFHSSLRALSYVL